MIRKLDEEILSDKVIAIVSMTDGGMDRRTDEQSNLYLQKGDTNTITMLNTFSSKLLCNCLFTKERMGYHDISPKISLYII